MPNEDPKDLLFELTNFKPSEVYDYAGRFEQMPEGTMRLIAWIQECEGDKKYEFIFEQVGDKWGIVEMRWPNPQISMMKMP